jgi:hypothetical protein
MVAPWLPALIAGLGGVFGFVSSTNKLKKTNEEIDRRNQILYAKGREQKELLRRDYEKHIKFNSRFLARGSTIYDQLEEQLQRGELSVQTDVNNAIAPSAEFSFTDALLGGFSSFTNSYGLFEKYRALSSFNKK